MALTVVVLVPFLGRPYPRLPPPACAHPDGPPASAPQVLRPGSRPAFKGPVGWASLRRLDRLPAVPIGVQTMMRSSSDPRGGNEDGFAGSYLCRTQQGHVLAEHAGPGELTSLWFTRGDGDVTANGDLRIELDGDTILDAPLQDVVDGRLGPPFVHPLVGNASESSGGVYVQVPMPFRRSMRVLTDAVPRFHRVQYRTFLDAHGVPRFDPGDPASDVLALLRAAGTRDPKPTQGRPDRIRHEVRLAPGQTLSPARLEGPAALTSLHLRLPGVARAASHGAGGGTLLDEVRLQLAFDGRTTVDAPIGGFFGVGLGPRPVQALTFAVGPDGEFRSWWPMPFADTATVGLHNGSGQTVTAVLEILVTPDERWSRELGPAGHAGHFHATARSGVPAAGEDWLLADLPGRGRVVGVTQTVFGMEPTRTYLEGDERVLIDGEASPRLHGTGTEDLYLGGWYFNRGTFSTPFSGLTAHLAGTPDCPHHCDAMYRVFTADAWNYLHGLRASIEHGPGNDVAAAYRTTTFWYGRREPAMHRTDQVDVGDRRSEAAAGYVGGGELRRLTARYLGPEGDTPITDVLRVSRQPVSFHVAVDPENAGVVLRRRADQARRGQVVRVLVDGTAAGTWLQPDGNVTHRWLDDQVMLPAALTRGRESIEVALWPLDRGPPWTAARYEAFSVVGSAQ